MLQNASALLDGPLVPKVVALILSMVVANVAAQAIYNVFFHPLSKYPGPLMNRISRIPFFYRHINGTISFDMLGLHQKYGNIVRIAPDMLAFGEPSAWKDIMGHRPVGEELKKSPWFYEAVPRPLSIINEPREEHGRLRRQLAHGFSDKGMREQEPIIKQYVDLLIRRLRERCDGSDPVAISDWYNYCTFDIIGDLAFGEPFGCLDNSTYHVWIANIFKGARFGTVFQALWFLPRLRSFILSLIPDSVRAARDETTKSANEKMQRRMAREKERPDLIEGLLKKSDQLGLDVGKLVSNAELLILAGSETTATLLSGATYYILQDPKIYKQLADEVRSTFKSEDEIDLASVSQLKYMLAVLNESLRMYPPVAGGLPRIVPESGARIMGQFIPPKTTVAVHQWAMYRREEYFARPHEFCPQRFLGDPEFASDSKDALQPFHIGPRNCIGRNLAYSEMRLIMARTIFNFDLRLDDSSVGWINQKNYLLWQKGTLKVHLTPVAR